jgi:hypothetical protein
MARLDAIDRHGSLIVTRDVVDRFKRVRLPWKKRHFLRHVAKIRAAAGIDSAIKFMGLRHGGNVEGAERPIPNLPSLHGKRRNAGRP